MAHRPHKIAPSSAKNSRYEIAFERSHFAIGALSGLLAELKALGERSGAALGDAYAAAARTVLNGAERLEDLNAERRYRHHAQAGARAPGQAPASSTRK